MVDSECGAWKEGANLFTALISIFSKPMRTCAGNLSLRLPATNLIVFSDGHVR